MIRRAACFVACALVVFTQGCGVGESEKNLETCQDTCGNDCRTGIGCGGTPCQSWECISQGINPGSGAEEFRCEITCEGEGSCEEASECDDENECTENICRAQVCEFEDLDDNTPCTDGVCMAGTCMAGTGGIPGCGPLITSFEDGDFADRVWSWEVVTERSAGTYSVDSVEDLEEGGNPGDHRRITATVTATDTVQAVVWLAHELDGASYDPSTGEVCGVRFYLDGTPEFDPVPQREAIFSVFLLQNETYYWGERVFFADREWTQASWPIPDPADSSMSFGYQKFAGDSPNTRPDLSMNGATIQFGFLSGASRPTSAPGAGTAIYGADNFRVELYAPEE